MAELKVDPGKMPDWGRSDLPAPPPYTLKNILQSSGPEPLPSPWPSAAASG